MRSICVATFAVGLVFVAQPARAQDAAQTHDAATTAPATVPRPITLEVPRTSTPRRTLLLSMYAGNSVLQGYDAYSTLRGLRNGRTEANPVMRQVAKSSVALVVAKAGISAITISTAERLWRTNRRGHAIAVMALSDVLMTLVAAHNHSVLRHLPD